MSLFAELKRRNVFRVAAAYLALGWIVTQVTSTVAPMLHLPDWIGPVVLWIGLIGFPFVLMFSWIYEITPEGIRKESEVDRTQSITHHTARRLDYVVIALLVVAIGLFAFHEFRPGGRDRVTVVARPSPVATQGSSSEPDRSVAVLPFVDMSASKNQEYFADGISEELLNLLAKVPQLRVIARTSSFSFKGKEADIAEIAKKLNVANVLEGSVRTSGDKVRITAQLIRASDSSHLWSETYDRELNDVFAVQDEIAAAVVAQLKVTLLGAAPTARKTDPKAYALYMQGRELERQASTQSLEQAVALLGQAVAIDPSYAPAWVQLAESYFMQVDLGVLTPAQGLELSHDALGKALAADPASASAYAGMALWETIVERKYDLAARHVEQALALDPTNLEAIDMAAVVARRLGRLDLAIALGEYLVVRDPVNPANHDDLALAYGYSGQIDKAIAARHTVLSLSPDAGWQHAALGDLLLQKGDANAALAEFQKEPIECFRLTHLVKAYHALGRKADSDATRTEMMQKCADKKPFNVAASLAYLGDVDGAFAMLEKAAQVQDTDLGAVAIFPAFAGMHKDPRWLPLMRRLGMAPEQLAAVKLDVKVPR